MERSSGAGGCAAEGTAAGRRDTLTASPLNYRLNFPDMNRTLIVVGAAFLMLGLGWSWFRHLPLFRLPGDIVIERPGFRFFFPITTMLLISALVSLAAWLLRR